MQWLEASGVSLSDKAGWGRAAHPLRIEADTVEDFEISGRGIIARKEISPGDAIVRVPSKIIMTRETAQRVLGASVVPDSLNEYLALAMLLLQVWMLRAMRRHSCSIIGRSLPVRLLDRLRSTTP